VRSFASRGVAACLVCTVVAAALPIAALKYHSFNNVPRWLAWLDLGVCALMAWLAAATADGAKKRKQRALVPDQPGDHFYGDAAVG